MINEEIVDKVDKIFEFKCISKKQQQQILKEFNLLHTKKLSMNTHIVDIQE